VYAALVFLGWLNIYAAVYDESMGLSIFNTQLNSGRQFIFICLSVVVIVVMMLIDYNIFTTFSYVFYIVTIPLLVGVLFMPEVNGANSWFQIGSFKFQPSEIAKWATALALAKYINDYNIKFKRLKSYYVTFGILLIPIAAILLQRDAGTVLVFLSFLVAFYREGMSPALIIIGLVGIALAIIPLIIGKSLAIIFVVLIALLIIGLVLKSVQQAGLAILAAVMAIGVIISIDVVLNEVLLPHQKNRILVLINPNTDPLGQGWNITQSKIAIGSGGTFGKGFLEGTQTKYDFVPEQSTDFIFCTIGEEHGWLGSLILIGLFMALLLRIIFISERQKYTFARVYGYCVAGVFFFHFMVNVGMTIGLFPVIGIPLPFFSYGGSSLLSFTILLFTLVKLDAHRNQIITR
jgi:rod shape determining protein RodA